MRKYIQLLFLLPAMLSAQERAGEYACRYWFDNNSTQLTEITLPGPNFSFEADANGLSEGLHSLNLLVSDGNGTLSGVKTGFFMRVPTSGVYTVQTLIRALKLCHPIYYWIRRIPQSSGEGLSLQER